MGNEATKNQPCRPVPTTGPFTVATVAKRYAVSEAVVLNWIRNKELSALKVSRSGSRRPTWRITRDALAEFEARRAPTLPAPRRQHRRKAKTEVVEFYH